MENSVFHIVKRDEGEFEIVQLSSVKKKANSKLRQVVNLGCESKKKQISHSKDNCKCVMCQPLLKQYSPKLIPNAIEERTETRRIIALKNYSRVRTKNTAKPILIRKEENATNKTITADSSITIKTEPELDIADEHREEAAMKTEKPSVEEKLLPATTDAIIDSSNTNIHAVPKATEMLDTPLLLKLATKNVKCNVCGMIFTKGDDQMKALRTHFLQHKTSMTKVARKYTGVRYRSDKLDDKIIQRSNQIQPTTKKPAILNNVDRLMNSELFRNITVKTYLPQKAKTKGANSEAPAQNQEKRLTHSNWPSILRRKNFDIDQKRGKSHFVIGNTVIKPVKHANIIQSSDGKLLHTDMETHAAKRSHEALISDGDDDIEIVEQKPELIVIDDNDEDDKPH